MTMPLEVTKRASEYVAKFYTGSPDFTRYGHFGINRKQKIIYVYADMATVPHNGLRLTMFVIDGYVFTVKYKPALMPVTISNF